MSIQIVSQALDRFKTRADLCNAVDQVEQLRNILEAVNAQVWNDDGMTVKATPDRELVFELIAGLRKLQLQAMDIEAATHHG